MSQKQGDARTHLETEPSTIWLSDQSPGPSLGALFIGVGTNVGGTLPEFGFGGCTNCQYPATGTSPVTPNTKAISAKPRGVRKLGL